MLYKGLIAALLAALGLLELGSRYVFDSGTWELVRHMISQHDGSEIGAQDLWDADGETKHHGRHGMVMEHKMAEAIKEMGACHMGCGKDGQCHERCPKPWQPLQDKCEEAEAIMTCHKDCCKERAGVECHKACPLPKCPHMARKAQETIKCHVACQGGDQNCHHQCPRTFSELAKKCGKFHQIRQCHIACEHGDHECHHACPSLWGLWHKDGDHDHFHQLPIEAKQMIDTKEMVA